MIILLDVFGIGGIPEPEGLSSKASLQLGRRSLRHLFLAPCCLASSSMTCTKA